MSHATSRSTLTPDRIIDAALQLIDKNGLEGLSMRKLGAAVGVEAMALYHHFRSKERLLEAVVERLSGEINAELGDTADWIAALHRMARAYRTLAQRHPGAIVLLAQSDLAARGHLAEMRARLSAAGVDAVLATLILHVVDSYAMGAVLAETVGGAGMGSAAAEEIFETGLALVLDRLRALPTQVERRKRRL